MSGEPTIAEWLEALPPARLGALAADYAAGLERDGLTVYRADEDRFLPIPPVLTPEILDERALAALADDARSLLSATVKVARWTLGDDGAALAARLYATFTPLEVAAIRRDPGLLERVATARVDYFIDDAGVHRALELNATIPAMQGYSDLIAHRFIRTVARERELPADAAERLVARAGSNTADLLASIVAHFQLQGGRAERPSILVVSRRGDAQLGELHHYVRAFGAAGHRAVHAWADEVDVDAAGRLGARGERFDLLYRHIFARRVPEGSTLARLLVDPGPNVILNPVTSPLEVKGMLALLHEAGGDPRRAAAFGLSDEELDAVRRVVPWTRLLLPAPATLADGAVVPDLAAFAAAHPERLVLKRSWDYGGKSVVLGPDADSAASRARMRELFGESVDGWPELCAAAVGDPGVWVVQELVPPRPRRHLLVERDAAGAIHAEWRELYVDVSAYANLGVAPRPRGAVCRASGSRIVNILGGGGLTPVLSAAVAEALAP